MRIRQYSMLEMVAALALLAVLTTAVVSGLSTAGEARVRMTQEARAILVLENTVTRLATREQWTAAALQSVLEEELAGVTMPRGSAVTATATVADKQVRLSVVKADGRPLAAVTVPQGGQR